ncbi:MAG: LamG-like jellyroll fold domain-containing protein [Planctomycetaceae bacterium]|nr:PEP-CTERM sorting domain-containing protein [Planctomycetaceae bacterium]
MLQWKGITAAMVLVGVSSLAQADLSTGAVAYYSFNADTQDATGDNPGGTLINSAVISNTVYKIGNGAADVGALNGGGYTDRVDIAQPNAFNFGSGAFSTAFWFRVNAHQSGASPIGPGVAGGAGWYINVESNGNWTLKYDTNTQVEQTIWLGDIWAWGASTNTNWMFFAMSVDPTAGSVTTWVQKSQNASLIKTVRSTVAVPGNAAATTGAPIVFDGSVNNTNALRMGYNFNATMDEVVLWNRALTDAETAELYNGGAGMDLTSVIGIPEPATMSLLAIGAVAALIRRRRN